jgi:hypothetical protein
MWKFVAALQCTWLILAKSCDRTSTPGRIADVLPSDTGDDAGRGHYSA